MSPLSIGLIAQTAMELDLPMKLNTRLMMFLVLLVVEEEKLLHEQKRYKASEIVQKIYFVSEAFLLYYGFRI